MKTTTGNYTIIMADLMMVLMITFLASLGVLAPLVHNEVLTYIEQNKTDKKSDSNAPKRSESSLLEITYLGNQHYQYHYLEQGKKKFSVNNYDQMMLVLEQKRPQVLRLRIDRRVDSGIYQDVILAAGKLKIRTWQENTAQ